MVYLSCNRIDKNKEKRKIINYGKTALQRARRALEEWKNRKDLELFSSVQHRISSEFVKYKTYNNFYKKNLRINYSIDLIKEQKRLSRMETKIKNKERFINHNNLYTIKTIEKIGKINKYINDYRKKEKISKLIREKVLEKRKRKRNDKEYPKDIILKRLDDLNNKEKIKNRKLRLKLNKKDLYLIELKKKQNEICEQRRLDLDNMLKEKSFRVYGLIEEQNKLREKKRLEIEKRYEEIDKFLYERELINEQRMNINNHYTNKYHHYLNRIDDILFKKNLDRNAINKIKNMVSTDPVLIGLEQNFIK